MPDNVACPAIPDVPDATQLIVHSTGVTSNKCKANDSAEQTEISDIIFIDMPECMDV